MLITERKAKPSWPLIFIIFFCLVGDCCCVCCCSPGRWGAFPDPQTRLWGRVLLPLPCCREGRRRRFVPWPSRCCFSSFCRDQRACFDSPPDSLITEDGCNAIKYLTHAMAWGFCCVSGLGVRRIHPCPVSSMETWSSGMAHTNDLSGAS